MASVEEHDATVSTATGRTSVVTTLSAQHELRRMEAEVRAASDSDDEDAAAARFLDLGVRASPSSSSASSASKTGARSHVMVASGWGGGHIIHHITHAVTHAVTHIVHTIVKDAKAIARELARAACFVTSKVRALSVGFRDQRRAINESPNQFQQYVIRFSSCRPSPLPLSSGVRSRVRSGQGHHARW
jgi:hypothetical protein